MAENKRKHWKSTEERDAGPDFAQTAAQEFGEELPRTAVQWQRRDFLKMAGFTTALAATAGCGRAPVQKAIPLLVQAEENVPGRSLQYATTCGGCSAGCGVLATVRDGRPIKLEGNPEHPLSRGGLCAVGQAAILGLYDSYRLQSPLRGGKQASWAEVDAEIVSTLRKLRGGRAAVRVLTATTISPTRQAALEQFIRSFPEGKLVTYDAISHSAILDAHERTHGARVLPAYHFDRADVILSMDADFLGTWISPVQFTAAYRKGRRLGANTPRLSWHVQFEPRLSLTGSKADERYPILPSETGAALSQVAQRLAAKAGTQYKANVPVASVSAAFLDKAAARLWEARGRSLVVSGSQDVREQVLVNYINHLLGNYGTTVDVEQPSPQAQGNDRELQQLTADIEQRKVAALFIAGANPAFELPAFADALKNVPLVVSFAQRRDETAALAHYVCPEPHFLESWSDAEAASGQFSVTQPTIRPLGNTRPLLESLAAWSGQPKCAYDAVREHWRAHVFPRQSAERDFERFWNRSVHDGHVAVTTEVVKVSAFKLGAVEPIVEKPVTDSLALVLYPTVNMLSGSEAYNAWLHELPDPISKTTWDNCANLSPITAAKVGVAQGDVIRIEAGGHGIELPVYVQPGQHDGVVAVALGYGSVLSERFANIGPQWIQAKGTLGDNGRIGQNAAPLLRLAGGALIYTSAATVARTGKQVELACTQTHHTLTVPPKLAELNAEPRPIVREASLVEIARDPHAAVPEMEEQSELWPADHPYTGPRWGMVIDLEACTGCSGCVIACQAENNIPVVGKDEVRRNREMHWLRVDRYFSERSDGRIDVAHQPMICQQCENAPCETVCPVLATVHSEDGLNQQVYNRCVGTRYCANNCPYKARRFNWFNYAHNDLLQNLALNPDVTVRSRGVMEKCTFCVQRIQAAKLESKRRGTKLADGDVKTACQQSCPARAIYFGDLNDPASEVSRMMRDPRRYRVLAELGVKPAVGYLAVIRNRDKESGEHHG